MANQDQLNQIRDEFKKKFSGLKESAEHFLVEKIEEKVATDQIFKLTEDEERILRAYRKFKTRTKPGAIFKWETPQDNEIVVPQEPSLVLDPREV